MGSVAKQHVVFGFSSDITRKVLQGFYLSDGDQTLPLCHSSLPLRRVNLLVGPNNSGKSRFLRAMVSGHPLSLADEQTGGLLRSLCRLRDDWRQASTERQIRIGGPSDDDQEQIARLLHDVLSDVINGSTPRTESLSSKVKSVRQKIMAYYSHRNENESWLMKLLVDLSDSKRVERALIESWRELKAVYVPLFRTASRFRHLVGSERDLLAESADQNCFHTREGDSVLGFRHGRNQLLFSGGELYRMLLAKATGSRDDRKDLEAFEELLQTEFFEGREVSIVPRAASGSVATDSLELAIEGSPQRPLHELGDGLGMIVLLLSPYFVCSQGSWIGIEEPEVGLHPAYQRRLMDVLVRNRSVEERKMWTWMTSHSPTLLGMASEFAEEVGVVSFRRLLSKGEVEQFELRRVENDYFDAMADLGLHNSSVLLANHMIWVEGPSDVAYLRAALKIHPDAQKAGLREDLDYAFFMYGGALLSHYELGQGADRELTEPLNAVSLANRIVLVMDRDTNDPNHAKSKLRDALVAASKPARFQALITEGWEIENELGLDLWNRLLGARFPDVDPATVAIVESDKDLRLGTAVQNASARWKDKRGNAVPQSRQFAAVPRAKRESDEKEVHATERAGGITLNSTWKTKFAHEFASLVNSGAITWDHLSVSPIGRLAGKIVKAIVHAKT